MSLLPEGEEQAIDLKDLQFSLHLLGKQEAIHQVPLRYLMKSASQSDYLPQKYTKQPFLPSLDFYRQTIIGNMEILPAVLLDKFF